MAWRAVAQSIVAGCVVLCSNAPAFAREAEERLPAEPENEEIPSAGAPLDDEIPPKEGEQQRPRLALGLELVVGFGSVYGTYRPSDDFSDPDLREPIGVHCESFVLSASYDLVERVSLGVRVPMTFGIVPRGIDQETHGTFAIGNLEITGALDIQLSKTLALELGLGVALPTAEGSQDVVLDEPLDTDDYDHYLLNEIAAASRGFEEDELFMPDRVGISLRASLYLRAGRALVEPFAKLGNLISTQAAEYQSTYIAELVVGTFVGGQLGEHVDLGARVWVHTAYAERFGLGIIGLEPALRAHFAPVDLVLGFLLPVAGELTDRRFFGVRLAVVGRL